MNNWGQEDLSSPTPSTYNNMAASPLGGMGGVAPAANVGAPQQAPYAGANQNLLAEQSFEAPPAVDPSMQPSPMAAQAADAFMNSTHRTYASASIGLPFRNTVSVHWTQAIAFIFWGPGALPFLLLPPVRAGAVAERRRPCSSSSSSSLSSSA